MATPTPALPPPPGVTSNFKNPPTLIRQNDIAMGISIPLVTIFFGLRSYARIVIKRTWITEDWVALLAYVGTVSFSGIGAGTMDHSGGRHEWDLTPAQAHQALYWFNICSIHYGIAICITKLAILWLYRRVFSPRRWAPFDISIIGLIVILILFYGITTFFKIFECSPRAKIYNPKIPGHCIDFPKLLNVSGLFNTITDVIVLLMPVKAVWNMNMKLQKKIIVVLVFTFGLCAPAFSLKGYLVRLDGTNNPDKTWVQPDIIMWGIAELSTGVLCVSLPEIGPIFITPHQYRNRGKPTPSILNGNYRKSGGSSSRGRSHGFSKKSTFDDDGKSTSDSFVELRESNRYDVEAVGHNNTARGLHGNGREVGAGVAYPGEVHVLQEVRVHSDIV